MCGMFSVVIIVLQQYDFKALMRTKSFSTTDGLTDIDHMFSL